MNRKWLIEETEEVRPPEIGELYWNDYYGCISSGVVRDFPVAPILKVTEITEGDHESCKICGKLTNHSILVVFDGLCSACYIKEDLLRKEYIEAMQPKMGKPFGSDMGD